MIITEFTLNLPLVEDIPVGGGRVHSISVHPTKPGHIIVVNRFGGLWKTVDGGSTWFHLDGLLTIFARDVAYSPDGKTVIATIERDNRVNNGGGIWVSHDEGEHWKRPFSGDPHNPSKVPHKSWVHKRISAYGISYAPDDAKRVYVGTDYGVAISTDNGDTWSHKMLEEGSPGLDGYIFGEKSVISILALRNNKAIALCRTGVYLTTEKFDKDKFEKDRVWRWNRINPNPGDFAFFAYESCKNIDVSPLDNDKVFIIQDYQHLLLYEVKSNKWSTIPTTTHSPPTDVPWAWNDRRGPFVRISKSPSSTTSFDIWLGSGMSLSRVTCKNIDAVKALKVEDWIYVYSSHGLHADSGYLGLDNKKLPILYGCDGGLFKPTNIECTKWERIRINSLLISDLGGTNVRTPKHTCLYITTQDNGVWGSGDGGYTWPNYDDSEGFHIQVAKDAKSDEEVRVAFGTTGYPNRFSKAHMMNPVDVPDVDTDGKKLNDLTQAYFISPGKWIRLAKPDGPIREIYVSKDNGEKWQKIADVALEFSGLYFAISKYPPWWEDAKNPRSRPGPVIYVPFKGVKTNPDGSEREGLIRLINVFDSWGLKKTSVREYDDRDLIYIGNKSGSLGVRFTDFDWHAVFGVDPRDPHFIIAPDVYNNKVLVSHDSGLSWKTDHNLTREVTKNNTLLLYDDNVTRVQVTCISFDPYNADRIYVGTRDAGVIHSTDAGKTWSTIPNSNRILYITNFFFESNGDTIIVSTYGRGLWKIQTWGIVLPFPVEIFCKEAGCNFRMLPGFEVQKRQSYWSDKDVIIFLNGRINGINLSDLEIKKITVTPGTTFERYIGKTNDVHDLRIVESEQGEGFEGLKGTLAGIDKGQIIKGLVLKDNRLIGIISGNDEFRQKRKKVTERDLTISKRNFVLIEKKIQSKTERKQISYDFKKPYLFIKTNSPVILPNVIGKDGLINLFAKGFKFYPNKNNQIKIMIDSQEVDKQCVISQHGNVHTQIKAPQELSNGIHTIRLVQKTNRGSLEATDSFVKAGIDEFEQKAEKKI